MTYMIVTMDQVEEGKEKSWHKNSLNRAPHFELHSYLTLRLLKADSNIVVIGTAVFAYFTLFYFFSFLQKPPLTFGYSEDSSSVSHANFLSRSTLYRTL